MTNLEITEKLKKGDKKALNWLFDQYYTKLTHYALKIISDPEASEEIVQDVFISIWKNRHKSAIKEYYPYLSRAVRNKCINYINSSLKNKRHEPIEHALHVVKGGDNHNNVEYNELSDALKDAEALLPQQTRLVFSLSRHSELTYAEISTKLDISKKTVEYHISKAFKIMRAFITSRGFLIFITLLMIAH
ncbi:MAG: RNA polymerase sigma-70 factor [Flammeovirgaceae bacterium]